jgi:2-hydroxy-3-keto-5-methylthiopentenyl-1-phosphate phosphatase
VLADGFKEEYTATFQQAGNTVIFLGDGLSDIYPARRADYVFACKELLRLCGEQGLPHRPFESLLDVKRGLEELADSALLN